MKRRIIIYFILLLFVTTGCSILKDKKEQVEGTIKTIEEGISLMEYGDFKNIILDKIKSVTLIKYTVAGRDDEEITDKDRIQIIYNNLKKLRVGQETNRACEDNTEIYVFSMSDGKKISLEIECEWLVVGNKRYEIK